MRMRGDFIAQRPFYSRSIYVSLNTYYVQIGKLQANKWRTDR